METNTLATHDSSAAFAPGCANTLSVPVSQHLHEGLEQLSMGEPAAALVAFNSCSTLRIFLKRMSVSASPTP